MIFFLKFMLDPIKNYIWHCNTKNEYYKKTHHKFLHPFIIKALYTRIIT